MTAKEARELAGGKNNAEANKALEEAKAAIKRSAESGQYTCTLHHWIHEGAKNALILDGYTVKQESCQREGEWCIISWA